MRQPQRVQVDAQHAQHVNITQSLFWADNPQHKRKLLDHWLRDTTMDQAIVFASTQIECDALAVDLQQAGFSAVALHGALSQGLRNRRLMALRQGMVQILVATDVAARGIDVPTISHVFNFGLPMKAEDYVHRIGRTGRAGASGLALSFVSGNDNRLVVDIEKLIKKKIELEAIEFDEDRPRERINTGRRAWGEDDPRDVLDAPRAPSPRSAPPARAPRSAPRDPFFDKPYEAPTEAPPPAWEPGERPSGRISANIKPKRKVAALFKTES
jgi:superfamily II DNA/RNA helicase